MYQGRNPSALRSREWIREALLVLMKEHKYVDITVKDICRKADLSRQTFYQIYESKEEVTAYHFETLFSRFHDRCGNFAGISVREIAVLFFRFFYEQRDFVQELIDNNLTYYLESQFEMYLPQIDLFYKINETEPYPDYSIAYLAGALTQMLIHWFENGFDLTVEEIGDLTEGIIMGNVFRLKDKK